MRLTFNNDKEFIDYLTEIVITNLGNENFGVDELVQATGLGHAVILHKLKSTLQKTISQFICEIRLQKAWEMLENETLTSAEVAYRVGFGSPAYFSSCFHDYFGHTPGEVRKKATPTNETSNNQSDNPSGFNSVIKNLFVEKRSFLMRLSQILITIIILWLAYMAFFDNTENSVSIKQVRNKSIAVLPFKSLGSEKEIQYMADGITEGITNQLNKIGNLRVISRTSSEHYRESSKSVPEIARELNVDYILEGSVQCYQNKARISVQLIDAKKDQHILSEQFDCEMDDIFAMQNTIVTLVSERLQIHLSIGENVKTDKTPAKNK